MVGWLCWVCRVVVRCMPCHSVVVGALCGGWVIRWRAILWRAIMWWVIEWLVILLRAIVWRAIVSWVIEWWVIVW